MKRIRLYNRSNGVTYDLQDRAYTFVSSPGAALGLLEPGEPVASDDSHRVFLTSGHCQVEGWRVVSPENALITVANAVVAGEEPLFQRDGVGAAPDLCGQLGSWLSDAFSLSGVVVAAGGRGRLSITSSVTGALKLQDDPSWAAAVALVGLCLTRRAGSTLVLDRPEAFLSGRGQAWVGSCLAATAAAGVSVVVLSYSDFLHNAVRLAVRKGALRAQELALAFVSEPNATAVEEISYDRGGTPLRWPKGFCEALDDQLDELLGDVVS